MYGIPLHIPESRLNLIISPSGVITSQARSVREAILYPRLSSMGMESRFAIPLLLSQTLMSPYHPRVLVEVVPALQLPFMVVDPRVTFSRYVSSKKVQYVAQLSRYNFVGSSVNRSSGPDVFFSLRQGGSCVHVIVQLQGARLGLP